jgi:hypothetical protein
MVLSLACVLLCLAAATALAAGPETITVDVSQTRIASLVGWGVQWDPYEYEPSPAGWRLTQQRLDFMKPALVRVMLDTPAYCLGFSPEGKPDYIWEHGEEAARTRLGSLLWILDYAQAHRIVVLLGEWGPQRQLGEGPQGHLNGPGDPRWSAAIADFVHWLRVTRGYTVLQMYNMMNEPNGDWTWPRGEVDYEAWATGLRNLRRAFDAHGLKDLRIVGPDNSGDWDWADRVSKAMPEAIGAWEMHWYATDQEVLDGQIEQQLTRTRATVLANDPAAHDKPFFMAEVGMVDGRTNGDQQPRVKEFAYGVYMADFAAQIARAGWEGAIAWDLDDAMHCVSEYVVPPTDLTLKVWGFWNTQGTTMGHPEDERIRPWFTPWSLLTRLFPRGSRLVATSQPDEPGLRVLASAEKTGAGLSIMVVNNSDQPRALLVRVPEAGKRRLYQYRYFDTDRPTDANGFPVPTGPATTLDLREGASLSMPGRGVVFLSTKLVR